MVPMTVKLDGATGMVALMAMLLDDEALQAAVDDGNVEAIGIAELMGRIMSRWEAQLGEERRQREPPPKPPKAKPGPKPKGTGSSLCDACNGKHRPHTCR